MTNMDRFTTEPNQHLLSLDVFRGVVIALMILVNTVILSPYALLNHATWNGCTLADLVFPCFLFVVGVSLVLSLSKQCHQNIPMPQILTKIIKRTLILFALGLLLNVFPYHMTPETLTTIRVYGVLQRIALCYLIASLAYLTMSTWMQAWFVVGLLVGYWMLLSYFPVPGFGAGDLTAQGNTAAYFDRLIFPAKNLYGKVFDPEGLLSTLPSIATTIIGNLIGIGLLSSHTRRNKCLGMIALGTAFIILGWIWSIWFPINKALWTSSYVLWTAGWALYGFAMCYWLIEIQQWIRWSIPFKIFGLNAIFAYFGHVLFFKIQLMIHLTCEHGASCNVRNYIIKQWFYWTTLPYASLGYALLSVLFWLFILSILYRNKIFIRV